MANIHNGILLRYKKSEHFAFDRNIDETRSCGIKQINQEKDTSQKITLISWYLMKKSKKIDNF